MANLRAGQTLWCEWCQQALRDVPWHYDEHIRSYCSQDCWLSWISDKNEARFIAAQLSMVLSY